MARYGGLFKDCFNNNLFNVYQFMNRNLIYTPFEISDLTDDDLGKPLLYVDKFDNQIGVLVGYTKEYIYVKFGSNKEPIMQHPKNFKKIALE